MSISVSVIWVVIMGPYCLLVLMFFPGVLWGDLDCGGLLSVSAESALVERHAVWRLRCFLAFQLHPWCFRLALWFDRDIMVLSKACLLSHSACFVDSWVAGQTHRQLKWMKRHVKYRIRMKRKILLPFSSLSSFNRLLTLVFGFRP